MENLFTYCAIIGGILFVGQLALLFIGMGGDHADLDMSAADLELSGGDFDFDGSDHLDIPDHSDSFFVGILSLRSIIAAVTVFGLAGKGALVNNFSETQAVLISFAAGAAVLYVVGWVFKELYKIRSDGTVSIQSTVGCSGKVYLTIPSEKESVGKVTISVAGRTMEYSAMTRGEELANGEPITVVAILAPDMVEVQGVNTSVKTSVSSAVEQ